MSAWLLQRDGKCFGGGFIVYTQSQKLCLPKCAVGLLSAARNRTESGVGCQRGQPFADGPPHRRRRRGGQTQLHEGRPAQGGSGSARPQRVEEGRRHLRPRLIRSRGPFRFEPYGVRSFPPAQLHCAVFVQEGDNLPQSSAGRRSTVILFKTASRTLSPAALAFTSYRAHRLVLRKPITIKTPLISSRRPKPCIKTRHSYLFSNLNAPKKIHIQANLITRKSWPSRSCKFYSKASSKTR